jgi:hypothetical protein
VLEFKVLGKLLLLCMPGSIVSQRGGDVPEILYP